MKTLTLLHNEFVEESIPMEAVQTRFFNKTSKRVFTQLVKNSPELSAALGDSKQNFSLYGLANLIDRKRNASQPASEVKIMLNTRIGLYEYYGSVIIPFESIREEHLGFSHDVAIKKIKSGDLPLVTFRLADSQKSKLLVHLDDLSEAIDLQRKRARKEMENHIAKYQSIVGEN